MQRIVLVIFFGVSAALLIVLFPSMAQAQAEPISCSEIRLVAPEGARCHRRFWSFTKCTYFTDSFSSTHNGRRVQINLFHDPSQTCEVGVSAGHAQQAIAAIKAFVDAYMKDAAAWGDMRTVDNAYIAEFKSGTRPCLAFRDYGPILFYGYSYIVTGFICDPNPKHDPRTPLTEDEARSRLAIAVRK